MVPVIALVGRPNVGKSTMFNRLTKSRDAIVGDLSGLTRDRQYGEAKWQGRSYILVDTGGISGDEHGMDEKMAEQSLLAIEEADVVLFLVDAKAGFTAADQMIGEHLRKRNKRSLLVANKIDNIDPEMARAEFAPLGMGHAIGVAGAQGRGVNTLLEAALGEFPRDTEEEDLNANVAEGEEAVRIPGPSEKDGIKIAIIGRPNVGKSTLVNRMLGEDRVIVYDQPGTTRDSIYIPFERNDEKYTLIDTAGVRKRGKIHEEVEKFSVVKTLQAIKDANVVIFVMDAREGVVDHDLNLLGFAIEAGRALVIAINKWDGLTDYQREQAETMLSLRLGFVPWAESVRISAKHGSGLRELFKAIHRAHASATKEFGTSEVNKALEIAYETNPPPSIRGHVSKLRYVHPGGANPPTFIVHGTRLKVLPESYKRYLENFFRKRFKLVGTPVRFIFREGANPYEGKKNVLTEKQIAKKRRLIRHVKRGK